MKRRDFVQIGTAAASFSIAGVPVAALAQGKKGGVINAVVQPEPPGLMIGITQNGPTQLISGNIYEGLLRYDDKLAPQPSLATSWTIASDGLTYTFKLKPNVSWHDGKPFTSADVVFSADQFLRKTHARLRATLAMVESIKALDPLTVEFKLKHPFPPFIGVFEVGSMPMVPKHVYDGTDYLTNPANNTPMGTGPLKFKEWVKGSYIHLVRNDTYHDPAMPWVDSVYYHVIPDAAARAAAFETGKVDVLPGGAVEYFDIARLAKLPNVQVTTKGWEFFAPQAWMWINNRNAPMGDVKVRQAMMYALNREVMRTAAWHGFAKVAVGPFNSNIKFFNEADVPKYKRDVALAKKLLAESSYKGEVLKMMPLPYGETWQRLAEITRQNLTEVGFKIELVASDVAAYNSRVGNWDYDLSFTFLYQYGDPAIGVARNFITSAIAKGSAFNNVEGYSNPKVDELFDRGARETDPEKRKAIYLEVQKILITDVPVAYLLELNFPTVYRSKVNNLISSGIGLNDGMGRAWIA